jgi:hypothetical protein
MRAFLKQYGTVTAGSIFLICLAFVAYVHKRYVQAEAAYLNHLGTVTFGPHIDTTAILNRYASQANHWLMLQAIGTGAILLASIFMVLQVWQQRTARVKASELATETVEE